MIPRNEKKSDRLQDFKKTLLHLFISYMNIQNVCSSRLTTGCITGCQVYTDFKAAVRPVLNRRIAVGLVLYACDTRWYLL